MSDYRHSEHHPSTSILEKELSILTRSQYSIAVNSCSSAIFIALKACGLSPGEMVFFPAYTSITVPSAIIHAGGTPVLVDVTKDLVICLKDLEAKILQHPTTKILLLSYMRCHIPNMDDLLQLLTKYKIKLVEDAAQALGAYWGDRMLGTIGLVGCYSTHSSGIITSGEGGLLTTDNKIIAAQSIHYSGAYGEQWKYHDARPTDEILAKMQGKLPCFSMRMANSVAKKALAQLPQLDSRSALYKKRYNFLKGRISHIESISFPATHPKATPVFGTLSFYIDSIHHDYLHKIFIELKEIDQSVIWYGNNHNNKSYWQWDFLDIQTEPLKAKKILSKLFEINIDIFESEKEFKDKCFSINKLLCRLSP